MPTPKKGASTITHTNAKGPSCGCSTQKSISEKMTCSEPVGSKGKSHKQTKTRVLVQYDCGFGNSLFIRGEGVSTLSWDAGTPMVNCGPSEWVWETDRPFSVAKFKVLVNDASFEEGDNHAVAYGKETTVTPAF